MADVSALPVADKGPRAPHGNSVVDKDTTPAEIQITSKTELHSYK
jgi:hypothetical protein